MKCFNLLISAAGLLIVGGVGNLVLKVQYDSAQAAPSKLGSLSSFRKIAENVASIVDRGDLAAAKVRIKDLEVAWDEAEAGLKPRAAKDWHAVDRSIDKALDELRKDKPDVDRCRRALSELLAEFDKTSPK